MNRQNVASCAQVMLFVRYICNSDLKDDSLFRSPLTERTRGVDVFNLVNDFIERENLSWQKCVGICTESTKASSLVSNV